MTRPLRTASIVLLLHAAATWPASGSAQPVRDPDPASVVASLQPISLTEAERLIDTANPEVRAARRAATGARADIERALARPNPQVGIEVANNNPNNFGYSSQTQRVRFDQLIEGGGKRALRGAVAGLVADAARIEVGDTLRQQRVAVHAAYWDLAAAQARAAVARRTAELLERLAEVAQRRMRSGDMARIDVVRLEVDAARSRNAARGAEGEVAAARVALARLLGLSGPLPEAADPLPIQPLEEVPDGVLSDALGAAIEARPDVRAARVRAAAADRQLELARALRRRDVVVSGSAEHNGIIGGAVFSVGATVPLLVFYDYSGEIRRAQSDLEGAREQLDRVRAEARAEVQRAAAALASAADRLRRAAGAIVPGAEQAAAGVEFAFARGASGLTDLLDAQRVRAAAGLDAADAAADYARARAFWLAATQWHREEQP